MNETFSYDEVKIMLDAIGVWVKDQDKMYDMLLPNDPFRDELAHYLYTAQQLQKKLRKISRSLEKTK